MNLTLEFMFSHTLNVGHTHRCVTQTPLQMDPTLNPEKFKREPDNEIQ